MSQAITWVRLGSIAEFVRGITFKPADVVPGDAPDTVRCMRTKNVQEQIDLSDVWHVGTRFVKRNEQFLKLGDLLVSSANSWNLVGKCCWVPEEAAGSTFGGFISVLRAKPDAVDQRYLYHWFSSTRTQSIVRSYGRQTTNISNLDFARCLAMEAPLPPLMEQRRIARLLDHVNALRAKRREAIALLGDLVQCVFLDMFGDAQRNPYGFPVQPFGNVARVKSGSFLPRTAMNTEGPYPVYGGNGIAGRHDNYLFELPKICIGRVGYYCGAVHLTEPKSWITDNALYVSEFVDDLSIDYLYRVLRHADLNQYASRSSQPLISRARLNDVPILIPPRERQEEHAKRVAGIEQLRGQHVLHLAGLDALFASIQHRAFRGELWADAPAA